MTRSSSPLWYLVGAFLFTAILFLASVARGEPDAGLVAGPGPAAAPLGITPTQPSAPPDAAADPGGFLSWAGETFHDARTSGALFSWGIIALFSILAAVWQVLKPKGGDTPSRSVALVAAALCLLAAMADVFVGAGHFATVATTAMPVAVALFMRPHVQRGAKAKEGP